MDYPRFSSMAKAMHPPFRIWHLSLFALKGLGYVFRSISNVGFEKSETLAFKPVKIFSTPVEFVFQTGFGIKINIAVVSINDVPFLT